MSVGLHTVHLGTHQLINYSLKNFNIQDNSMWYNKSKFGFILRKCFNPKYLSDWKDKIAHLNNKVNRTLSLLLLLFWIPEYFITFRS
jgi:hypothetical protein